MPKMTVFDPPTHSVTFGHFSLDPLTHPLAWRIYCS